MRDLRAVARNPVGVVRQALDDINRLVLAGQVNVANDPLGALAGFNKCVEVVDQLVVELAKSLMLGIRLRLPVHEVRLVACLEETGNEFLHHHCASSSGGSGGGGFGFVNVFV